MLDGAFYLSDMYNLVYRRFDQHHFLIAPVLLDGKPVGMLGLYRPREQKPFNSHEQALCTQMLPYLAHACAGGDGEGIQYGESSLPGMIVVNTQGQIQYLTHEAKYLLALACHSVLSKDAHNQEAALLTKLSQLCRSLQTIAQGQHAAPPSWCYTNGRGRFTFRAEWLNKLTNEQDRMISLTITHQEPLSLKILRALQDLPLSPVQKQVALLLAQRYSNEKIGGHLHIKLTTVKDHISKIFDKMGIYHREELLPKLLALEKAGTRIQLR